MRLTRSIGAVALVTGFALGSVSLSGGCGSGNATGQAAAELSPEMQKKQDTMLQDYGKMYQQKYRAKKGR